MPGCIPLKEVRGHLENAARTFAPVIKAALDLWLQAADDLPRHAQDAGSFTATQLVQTALQQAPWRVQDCESKQVAWLQKHLPGISTAMHICVSSQLNTCNKRTSILHALLKHSLDTDTSARADQERRICLLVEALSLALLVIQPVAALCKDMLFSKADLEVPRVMFPRHAQPGITLRHQTRALFDTVRTAQKQTGATCAQRNSPLGRLKHSLTLMGIPADAESDDLWAFLAKGKTRSSQHGNHLVSKLMISLRDGMQKVRAPVHAQIMQAHKRLQDMDIPHPEEHSERLSHISKARNLISAAGAAWVQLVMRLPSMFKGRFMFMALTQNHMVECEGFLQPNEGCLQSVQLEDIYFAAGLNANYNQQPRDLQRQLQYFKEHAKPLQAASLPTAQQQSLLVLPTEEYGVFRTVLQSKRDQARSEGNPCCGQVHASKPPALSSRTTGSIHGSGSGSGAAADLTAAMGDLDDMQALLQQMYGNTLGAGF